MSITPPSAVWPSGYGLVRVHVPFHPSTNTTRRSLTSVPFPEGYGASVHFAWPNDSYIPLGVYVLKNLTWHTADASLTNNKPSAIYRLRPHLPQNIPQGPTAPANLGIEIAPLSQLEALQAQISGGGDGKGKEVAAKVEVGKVAEKIVRNVGAWAQCDRMHDPLIAWADSQLFNYLHSFGGEVKLT